jgi:hypothetical protein
MAAKDRYDNNIRRGERIKDLSDHSRGEGEVVATSTNVRGRIIVRWDDSDTETSCNARDVVLIGKAMR